VSTAADLFGGNSDGSVRMEDWLAVMCRGCVRDRGRGTAGDGHMGGMSCDLPARAYFDAYGDGIEEWAVDASPVPERFAGLGPGPWPVCMAYEPRKTRADKGMRRGPRVSGMEPMFDLGAA
jgi:hypothetical protein